MKLSAVAVCKWKLDSVPYMLGCSVDLSEFSFFQRGSVKEFMVFTGKTCIQKTQPGARLSVKAQAFMCHVVVRDNHMAAFIFADEAYPSRAAMAVGVKLIEEFTASGDGWRTASADGTDAQALCDTAIVKYQVRACSLKNFSSHDVTQPRKPSSGFRIGPSAALLLAVVMSRW